MYHYWVEGKTLRQKFRESSLQGPVRSHGALTYAWDVQELPYRPADCGGVGRHTTTNTCSTLDPLSHQELRVRLLMWPLNCLLGWDMVPAAHTPHQGDELGWANGVGGGTCLQMFHHAGEQCFLLGDYLTRGLAVILGKTFGWVEVPYYQRGLTYMNPE